MSTRALAGAPARRVTLQGPLRCRALDHDQAPPPSTGTTVTTTTALGAGGPTSTTLPGATVEVSVIGASSVPVKDADVTLDYGGGSSTVEYHRRRRSHGLRRPARGGCRPSSPPRNGQGREGQPSSAGFQNGTNRLTLIYIVRHRRAVPHGTAHPRGTGDVPRRVGQSVEGSSEYTWVLRRSRPVTESTRRRILIVRGPSARGSAPRRGAYRPASRLSPANPWRLEVVTENAGALAEHSR
jgi:hypothetical protein